MDSKNSKEPGRTSLADLVRQLGIVPAVVGAAVAAGVLWLALSFGAVSTPGAGVPPGSTSSDASDQ